MTRLLPSLLLAGLVAGCAGPFAPGSAGLLARGDPHAAGYRSPPPYAQPPQQARGGGFVDIPYATWTDDEPDYRLYPGDQLDVSVLSAPELSRSVTVQPDGRITLPLLPPIMVADRSTPQVEAALTAGYAGQLLRPTVSVSVKQATSLKVFVGGEVDKPGVYDMPGDINALQAVIMAGGFKTSAKSKDVVILRRGPGGEAMMRTADLRGAARSPYGVDAVPLRRFDVVFVPRTGLSEVGVFVQKIRDVLPVQFSYVVNGMYVTTR
ncbi:MAG TPA: polysaccharide biosynthesis/export family protein [Caulobacteraceae bacterium]|jgi:polysaccharide export outer membrane protein|nr:polysaccharide biosynthesis/export family protein [Caulobacteraceae bacterium]